mmetsp:Transcript_61844/g.144857  ORF Transcript_61844/g.144857 Transcript_61844/m.144857 type:complete len:339 (-) Transcript_61844:101-1117(-)
MSVIVIAHAHLVPLAVSAVPGHLPGGVQLFVAFQGLLLLLADGDVGEVDAIARWPADGQEPEQRLITECRFDVAVDASIIQVVLRLRAIPLWQMLLAELNRAHGVYDQIAMEAEEESNQQAQKGSESGCEENQEHGEEGSGNFRRSDHSLCHCNSHEVAVQRRIEEQQEEIFVVVVSDTIVDPRAVMVHLQSAGAADSAVVSSVRLELAAPFAVPPVARSLRLFQEAGQEGGHAIFCLIVPVPVSVWDRASRREDGPQVADDHHGREDVKREELHLSALPDVFVDVLWGHVQLHPGHAVLEHVNQVQKEHRTGHEGHGHKLLRLGEPLSRRLHGLHGA